jgi:hypothetical protein
LSLKKCEEIVKKEPENIVLDICDSHFGYEKYLSEERMGKELVSLLVKILIRAFQCNSMREQISRLIIPLPSSLFINKHVYNEISVKLPNQSYNLELIEDVMNLYSLILETNPSGVKFMEPLKERLEIIVLLRIQDQTLKDNFKKNIIEMDTQAIERTKQLEEEKKKEKSKNNNSNIDPPNDFSKMSIIPNASDIKDDLKPFLRENIVDGAYKDVHHYLDVQFRLLREDYMKPLRKGIKIN